MRVKSNKLALRVLSTATFLAMVSSCATAAFAGTYYMEKGSISIVAKTDGNYITQGDINDKKDEGETVITNRDSSTASENTVTIKAEEGSTANVTLDNVNIDASDTDKAALTVTGTGDTEIELSGDNALVSGSGHAGLEKSDTYGSEPSQNGSLTINAEDSDSSLTATGGTSGAGIGGASHRDSSNITITGGSITATAGSNSGSGRTYCGAGIGGGAYGKGNNINITGGTVNATGGEGNSSYHFGGAGIGGGFNSGANNITISGNDTRVTATGKDGGAGIGGGYAGTADSITISGGTVDATGGSSGAGIGGGGNRYYSKGGSASNITISGDNTHVTISGGYGGAGAAGIGDGANNVSDVGSVISITGGTVAATGGAGEAAGIGNGEKDAQTAAVNISATNAVLDVTAVTQGSGEAITGGEDLTMAKLNNRFSGVVRFFRGEDHYNTVHNGKYVGMDNNNADEHKETDAHIWGSTEIIRQATPTEQGILRHHCAVDGCKGYYEEFFDYVAPAEPVTPAPTDPDTPDVPGTSDSTPGAPAQGTPADAATADAVPGAAAAEEVSVTPSGAQTVTAAALPKTGVNWLAAVGSAISGMVLLAAGYVLDRKSRRQN